ncbi:hypothetical protein GCM10007276_13660 [Agaricicola taiwanensis]|uniref:DUF2059 domain-containing protein n=1 Tax=Agaricicola taiwanensis TaxID=591372 RepID=A0A8J2YCM7_9RHOB|nr:DUF2059 domain-containing protein [Agaricicola taiwanensis]GGE37515.1 hypothetical protein GCM10007276_13660 [Agaricicola taiwanensis]
MKSLTSSLSAIALAAALVLPASAAFAQAPTTTQAQAEISPEHLALARAVIDFTGAGNSFDNIVPQILADAQALILRTQPALQSDLAAVVPQLEQEFEKRRDDLLNDIARTYAESFSEDELKQIAAFYQSAIGRKLTETTPKVLEQSYVKARNWGQAVSSEVMIRLREEMEKRGHNI